MPDLDSISTKNWIGGYELQYSSNSRSLYFFTFNLTGQTSLEGGYNNSYSTGRPFTALPAASAGVNYLYSTDFGNTWEIQRSFAAVRRAYELVGSNEVWFTLIGNPKPHNVYSRAYIIARTTDNGISWEFDSTTLENFEQKLDGRIIASTDSRHIWIAATDEGRSYIFRYDANEQPRDVQPEMFLRGGYGTHYTLNPNPASEIVYIDLYRYLLINEVTAINILGVEQIVPATITGSRVELDVRTLPIGHYTLRIMHNWGISVIPLVVMR